MKSLPETYHAEHFRRYYGHSDPVLRRLEMEAAERDIPIVGPAMGRLLFVLARATGARRVLELGTSVGYSTIWLARAVARSGGKVVSLEWDQKTAETARQNLAESGVSKYVEIIVGDAREEMKELARRPPFDLAFNDIEKEMYSGTLDPIARLLRPGGLIVFDNSAFRSAGDFLDVSMRHPLLETVHLHCFLPDHSPDHDAITLCVMKDRKTGNR